MGKKYLEFKPKPRNNEYNVFNNKGDYLGDLAIKKIGRKNRWCFFPDDCSIGDMWFTHECLEQIAQKLKTIEFEVN